MGRDLKIDVFTAAVKKHFLCFVGDLNTCPDLDKSVVIQIKYTTEINPNEYGTLDGPVINEAYL